MGVGLGVGIEPDDSVGVGETNQEPVRGQSFEVLVQRGDADFLSAAAK